MTAEAEETAEAVSAETEQEMPEEADYDLIEETLIVMEEEEENEEASEAEEASEEENEEESEEEEELEEEEILSTTIEATDGYSYAVSVTPASR